MTRDEQLIKAALDMAAETCEKSAYAADADGHHFAYSIRAIPIAEVLAKVGGARSEENRQNDQQMLGETVVLCHEEITPDAALAAMETDHD